MNKIGFTSELDESVETEKVEGDIQITNFKEFLEVNKTTFAVGAIGFGAYLLGLFVGYKISQNAVNSCVRECARCFDVTRF